MKKSRFSEEKIIAVLKQWEAGGQRAVSAAVGVFASVGGGQASAFPQRAAQR